MLEQFGNVGNAPRCAALLGVCAQLGHACVDGRTQLCQSREVVVDCASITLDSRASAIEEFTPLKEPLTRLAKCAAVFATLYAGLCPREAAAFQRVGASAAGSRIMCASMHWYTSIVELCWRHSRCTRRALQHFARRVHLVASG